MIESGLTKKEKLMLYGLTNYPKSTDKDLSTKIGLKHSTVTAIRHRLKENGFFYKINIPRLQNMGSKMLVVIYTNFNPLIPLEERVKITGKTIEVFEEIFFSIGEQDKGFSISLSEDYASIGRINDIRTKTFGVRGLLEEEYPHMVVFPFEISKVYRFFDFAPLIMKSFDLDLDVNKKLENIAFLNEEKKEFSDTEKNVFCMLVSLPECSDKEIGKKIGVSRHTVSRMRRNFENQNLIRTVNLPNLKKLGFEILTFYHIRFDPRTPPNFDKDEATSMISDSTILFASRMFEAFMLSIHIDYDDFKKDTNRIMQLLKENNWGAETPIIKTFSLNELHFIKDFKFAPITKKILNCPVNLE